MIMGHITNVSYGSGIFARYANIMVQQNKHLETHHCKGTMRNSHSKEIR
jgi:hypothetical protein